MTLAKLWIDKEAYGDLKGKARLELSDYCENNLPSSVLYGYGFYGANCIFETDDGRFYIEYWEGSSCD